MAKKKASTKKPQSLAGLHDILPETNYSWDLFSRRLQNLARGFGFWRVETPLLESAADDNDPQSVRILDPEGAAVALREKALRGVLRAYAEHPWPEDHTLSKWYYLSPVARYDLGLKKYMVSWEYGFELLGAFPALMEAQLIALAVKLAGAAGVSTNHLQLEVNSVGTAASRQHYDGILTAYLKNKKYDLCTDCANAIETYPLAVFRCKNLDCIAIAADAPQVIDYLSDESRKELTDVLESLDQIGIAYSMNPMLVGPEGTEGLVFSLKSVDDGKEFMLGEGAGHSGIMESVADKKIRCFGFSGSLETMRSALQGMNMEIVHQEIKSDVYLVPLGDLASKRALRLFSELWDADVAVHSHFGTLGVKLQLKQAEAAKASIALIIGQKEAMDEMVILRDVKSGMQEIFQYERIIDEVKKRLGK